MTTADSHQAEDTVTPSFETFYNDVYLDEHTHPANVALHIGGTIAGLAFILIVLAQSLGKVCTSHPHSPLVR